MCNWYSKIILNVIRCCVIQLVGLIQPQSIGERVKIKHGYESTAWCLFAHDHRFHQNIGGSWQHVVVQSSSDKLHCFPPPGHIWIDMCPDTNARRSSSNFPKFSVPRRPITSVSFLYLSTENRISSFAIGVVFLFSITEQWMGRF